MIGRVKRVDLRTIWKNEATDFTTWLEKNVDALIEAVGFDLTVVKREQDVGSFSIDILAVDEAENKVVIENQLEKTDHAHLGQILTYCANLEAKTCIWISKEPRQEHINAVNWLNRETSLNFYMIQVEAISIGTSEPAPLFQVICRPDETIRSATAAVSTYTEREKFILGFWAEINKKCEQKLPGFTSRRPLKYNFHSQASGRGGLSFTFLAGSKYYGLELYIDTTDGNVNESIFRQLESRKTKIEKDFGHPLDFDPIPDKRACRIRYVISKGDVMDLDRNKVQAELIDHMVRFEKAIKPILKDLNFESDEAA